jgi:hypothetical protein
VPVDGFTSVSESLSDSAAWNLHVRAEDSAVDAAGGVNPSTRRLVICFPAGVGAVAGSRHLRLSTDRVLRKVGRVVSLVDTLLVAIKLLSFLKGLSPSWI